MLAGQIQGFMPVPGNKPDMDRISANASVVGADRWDIPRHSGSHVNENVTKLHFNDVITHAGQYIHSANEVWGSILSPLP